MKYDFDKLIDRRNTRSVKWDYRGEKFGRSDVLPMWVADMDFPSPPGTAEAIAKRAEHGVFGYMGISEELTGAIIGWMEKRNGWRPEEGWVVHSPGVVTSILTAILAYTETGDGILIQTPVYRPFYSSISDNGRKIVASPLINNNGRYEMDFDDLERKLASGVRMMILCSPHNPVGRVWTAEELKNLAGLCVRHNCIVVSDEIHSDLIYRGYKHTPFAVVRDDILPNTVTCISPTKTFNLAGLSESMAIIPDPGLRRKFQGTMHRTGAGMLNIFGLEAARAAYLYGEPWLEELLSYLEGNAETLAGFVRERLPSIRMEKPEGTYLAWLDCRELMDKVGNLKSFFVSKAGVGMNEGVEFGREGEGFQRLNFACPRAMLEDGLQRMENAIKGMGSDV